MKKFFKWFAIAFVALLVIGLIFGEDTPKQKAPDTNMAQVPSEQATPQKVENTEVEPEAPGLTRPQSNAVRSAENYIRMTGFSREGLIQQLSSSYGDGYELADATTAVDSLDIDWNEQAVRSAKKYLEMSGFSCNGLIEQLSSSAGDKYTVDQATYGAQQAGACS